MATMLSSPRAHKFRPVRGSFRGQRQSAKEMKAEDERKLALEKEKLKLQFDSQTKLDLARAKRAQEQEDAFIKAVGEIEARKLMEKANAATEQQHRAGDPLPLQAGGEEAPAELGQQDVAALAGIERQPVRIDEPNIPEEAPQTAFVGVPDTIPLGGPLLGETPTEPATADPGLTDLSLEQQLAEEDIAQQVQDFETTLRSGKGREIAAMHAEDARAERERETTRGLKLRHDNIPIGGVTTIKLGPDGTSPDAPGFIGNPGQLMNLRRNDKGEVVIIGDGSKKIYKAFWDTNTNTYRVVDPNNPVARKEGEIEYPIGMALALGKANDAHKVALEQASAAGKLSGAQQYAEWVQRISKNGGKDITEDDIQFGKFLYGGKTRAEKQEFERNLRDLQFRGQDGKLWKGLADQQTEITAIGLPAHNQRVYTEYYRLLNGEGGRPGDPKAAEAFRLGRIMLNRWQNKGTDDADLLHGYFKDKDGKEFRLPSSRQEAGKKLSEPDVETDAPKKIESSTPATIQDWKDTFNNQKQGLQPVDWERVENKADRRKIWNGLTKVKQAQIGKPPSVMDMKVDRARTKKARDNPKWAAAVKAAGGHWNTQIVNKKGKSRAGFLGGIQKRIEALKPDQRDDVRNAMGDDLRKAYDLHTGATKAEDTTEDDAKTAENKRLRQVVREVSAVARQNPAELKRRWFALDEAERAKVIIYLKENPEVGWLLNPIKRLRKVAK